MLTCPLQASSYAFDHPPYASDNRTSRSLRTLLQTLSPVCSNTRLRNSSCHISGTHLGTRSLHLDTFSFNCHSSISTLRSLILLLSIRIRKPRPEHPSPATDSRRNRVLLLSYSPSQVLTTTSAHTLTKFSTTERAYGHCLQCGTYSRRNNMAHSTWVGINCLCR
jgi:hypothetical protein